MHAALLAATAYGAHGIVPGVVANVLTRLGLGLRSVIKPPLLVINAGRSLVIRLLLIVFALVSASIGCTLIINLLARLIRHGIRFWHMR